MTRPAFRALLPMLLFAAAAQAAGFDPAFFGALHWRMIGPFRGGRVLAVAGVPGDGLHWYFGAVNGGVWETRDAGRTWTPIFDREPVQSIGALAVAPSDPNVLYVGTGEADMRSDIAQGDGVYKSTDGGKTWTHLGLDDTQQIGRILVDPRDADTVYVAALGHPYGPNAARGVFKSSDGGRTWKKILYRDADTGAIDLAFEPGHPEVLYAALWATRRPPWSVYPPSDGPGSGLYKSTDAGAHWTKIEGGGFPVTVGRIGLALSPAQPARVYALVAGDDGGLYRSDDGGAHWRKQSGDPRIWQRGWYFGALAVDPKNADRVWALNTIVLRSDDGGKTFAPEQGDPTGDDFHAMWIDPEHPQRRILGVDQGAILTLDDGKTWSSWYNQPTAQIYRVATDQRFPYWVYGAQQDSGAVALPSRTIFPDGIALPQFRELVPGGESDMIAPDPRDPELIYGGRVDRLDLRTEQTRSVPPTLAVPDVYRSAWTLPLAFSPAAPQRLYFGNQKLWLTEDGGAHWRALSGDLTREDPETPATLDPATAADKPLPQARLGVIYAIAPSPRAADTIWIGTDDGRVWRTTDHGAHWSEVTPPGLSAWSKIAGIDASPFDADSAYVAVDRHRLDDFAPYLYRTHDGGKTWTPIVSGIGARDFLNAVRADPVRAGLLYAATEHGVYVSFDDGEHWQSLSLNLPPTSVRDLVVHGDDLVIATHGRGFWILDDVAVLRQLDAGVARQRAWLFAPPATVRFRMPGFVGTPLPKDEPMAPNPPNGVPIDYWLAADARQPVVLRIADAQGHEVRRWSSADAAPAYDPAQADAAPQWHQAPPSLSGAAGAHRFVWDFLVAPPAGLDASVWAPPGSYTAVLDVDGKTYRQDFELRPDPRVSLPASAYAEQFELARAIERERARLAPVQKQLAALRAALVEARSRADAEARSVLEDFDTRLERLAGKRATPNPKDAAAFPPPSVTSLGYLDQALQSLQQAVDGADAAPSPDARAGYAALRPLIDQTLEEWKALSGARLEALNRRLQALEQAPLPRPH
ncbi:MAG: hypothetical protein IRZ06_09530 [Nevskia sp.]|nr:hypothetical protein [Nevskia sp.]